ncbi:MAG: glycyl-radical enzyme activating protein [Coprothermobacterota bacterium]|nr:glycyl-radical enzyme activating protein [Coprothermobacterota bacterium]
MQGFSVHDGPGCRTVVFLSGCPLSCPWCANPEGLQPYPQLLFTVERCLLGQGCRRCLSACCHGALEEGEVLQLSRRVCAGCEDHPCVTACHSEALRVSARRLTLFALMSQLARDRRFWGSGGGVTFSGGEPLAQPEFILSALAECRRSWIHTAVETCGYAEEGLFREMLVSLDWLFLDFKLVDSTTHQHWTGVSNAPILANLENVARSGWQGRLVLRLPVIPGVNDGEENARETARLMRELGLLEIHLLPFHCLGEGKWRQLGETYLFAKTPSLPLEALQGLQRIFISAGLRCYLGWETPF